MYTLDNFYKSKEWEKFRKCIIDERTNERGEILCAHCHRPIVNRYDLIVHHKKELTDLNVNDYTISLNPDNVECICFRCHNEEHRRFGHEGKKKVYIVYGAPCSGKVEWVRNNAGPNDLVVDMDSIYEAISINDRYIKSNRLSSVAFGIRDKLYEMIRYRDGKWCDAYVIIGGALRMDRERLTQRLNGECVFIDTPKDKCLLNLSTISMRDKARKEWEKYIDEWFEAYQP